jgi:hypothetical protein
MGASPSSRNDKRIFGTHDASLFDSHPRELFYRDVRLLKGAAALCWWNTMGRHLAAPLKPSKPCDSPELLRYEGMKSEDSSTDSAKHASKSAA